MNRPGFLLELTGFQLILDDWILWQPNASQLFRPDNLRKVWSRGLEARSHFSFAVRHWKFQTSERLQLSKTTNVAVYGGSESVLRKQLPYTPRISGGLTIRASRGMISAAYLQQFTGERFDNGGKTIAAFSIGSIMASCALLKRRLVVDFRLENLWNTPYEIIRYRPMPGRAWRLGLGFNW